MSALDGLDRVGTFGAGAFSSVGCYRGDNVKLCPFHKNGHSLVAVKMYRNVSNSPRYLRIQHEVKVLKTLTSRNSCKYVNELNKDIIAESGVYLFLRPALGGSLNKHIVRGAKGRLSPSVAKGYAAEIFTAIQAVHSLWCVHRDVKANNILLDHHGHAILCDFGSAKCLSRDAGGVDRTSFDILGNVILPTKEQPLDQKVKYAELPRTYTMVGTPHAMAPEVANKVGHSFAADWWGCGVLLYEMLCGAPPQWHNREVESTSGVEDDWDWTLPTHDGYGIGGDAVDEAERRLHDHGLDLVALLVTQDPAKRWELVTSIQSHAFFVGVDWSAVSAGTSRPADLAFDRRLGLIDILEVEEARTATQGGCTANDELTAEQQALFDGY